MLLPAPQPPSDNPHPHHQHSSSSPSSLRRLSLTSWSQEMWTGSCTPQLLPARYIPALQPGAAAGGNEGKRDVSTSSFLRSGKGGPRPPRRAEVRLIDWTPPLPVCQGRGGRRPFWPPCTLGATSKATELAKRKHIRALLLPPRRPRLPPTLTDVYCDVKGVDGCDTLSDETSFSSTGMHGVFCCC